MAENNDTIFQRLSRVFRGTNRVQFDPDIVTADPYANHQNDVIFSTTNKDEYEKKLETLKQQKYLNYQWIKASADNSMENLNSYTAIKLMYRDVDLMDGCPEIGTALDIISQEVCALTSDGRMLCITSKSPRIKAILDDLFTNRLHVYTELPMIARHLCKYGNTYQLLNVDKSNGILGWMMLPVYEVDRIENGFSSTYGQTIVNNNSEIKNDEVSFMWRGHNGDKPYKNWQIAHFRLLNDSFFLPYGVSLLHKARRAWRMWSMMEDAMLIWRLDKAVERRVYKIYVGGIDDQDVKAYVNEVANNFKRAQIIDPLTGQVDLRKNFMPVWKNTPIPLLDGRTITIEDLSKEYENGKTNYVYSIQDNTQQIVPGKVVWCGKNYTANKMIKVTLDDGGYIMLAPEHEFIMRDGSKKRADELNIGDSVMPFYTQQKAMFKNKNYETVFNPHSGKYEWTHRVIAKEIEKPISEEKINTVHHKNFNKYDNSPNNLQWCNFHEHKKMHGEIIKKTWNDPKKRKSITAKLSKNRKEHYEKYGCSKETRKKISDSLKKTFSDPKYKQFFIESGKRLAEFNRTPESRKRNSEFQKTRNVYEKYFKSYNSSELHNEHNELRRQYMQNFWRDGNVEEIKRNMTVAFDDFVWTEIENAIYNGNIYNRQSMLDYINTFLLSYLLQINTNKRLHRLQKISRTVLQERIQSIGFNTITDYINTIHEKVGGSDPNEKIYQLKSDTMKKFNKNNRKVFVAFDDNIYTTMRTQAEQHNVNCVSEMTEFLNESMIEYIRTINNLNDDYKLDIDTVTRRIISLGFKTTTDYFRAMQKNHKVVNIEIVEGDDVYCMSVVGLNGEDDRHNFALLGIGINQNKLEKMSGCFVSNSATEDIFIPVRREDAPTPIDTLPGLNSQIQMEDIEYMQNKMLCALRVPKQFLNFSEAQSKAQNLSYLDIRFARMINRVQQYILLELNKIAMIHLYLLGLNDEIGNFNISLNNPSTLIESQELDDMSKRVTLLGNALADPGNGFPIISYHKALRDIMKMSDQEIMDMLSEIRLEKAMAAELENTAGIITKTGMFDQVDRIYGNYDVMNGGQPMPQGDGHEGGMGPGGHGGGFGGGMPMMDGGLDDGGFGFGGPDNEGGPDIGGEMGETGMENAPTADMGAPLMESKKHDKVKSFTQQYFEMLSKRNDDDDTHIDEAYDFEIRNKTLNEQMNKIMDKIETVFDEDSFEREQLIEEAMRNLSGSSEAELLTESEEPKNNKKKKSKK